MITFSMSWWELALIIIAVCIIFGTVSLVRLFKSLASTINNADRLLTENRKSIDQIMDNLDGITSDASEMTTKANQMTDELQLTLRHVEEDVLNPSIAALSKVSKVLGIVKKKV